ncbi:MAG: NYN domain-containing protein [Pseudomonadota bacterium]
MKANKQAKLAVLIDADNAQAMKTEGIFLEVEKYGIASVKRAYGDWTSPNLKGWINILPQFAIKQIQQVAYTAGKNATDSAMIIDAMDLLYLEKLDGFCIVSSDSDFTPLATRIRKSGLSVYGFGQQKTPKPFVAACDKFIYTEDLQNEQTNTTQLKCDSRLIDLLKSAVDGNWTHLGGVGQKISMQFPGFSPRNYGYKKLLDLITAIQLFEVRQSAHSSGKSIYVRRKTCTKTADLVTV